MPPSGRTAWSRPLSPISTVCRASGPSRPTTRARWSVRTTIGRSTSALASRRPPSPATTSSPLWTSSSRRLWSGPWPTAWAPSNPRTPRARRRWLLTSMTAACWPPPPIPPMICPPSSRTIPNWPTTRSTPCSTGPPRGSIPRAPPLRWSPPSPGFRRASSPRRMRFWTPGAIRTTRIPAPVLVLPPVRPHPRQGERLRGHPGLLQHLLLRCGPPPGHQPAG